VDIVSPRDLKLAAVRMETYLSGLTEVAKETPGKVVDKPSGIAN